MRTLLLLLVSVVSVGVSCRSDAMAPLDAVVVQITVAPGTVISGDTVHLTVTLANPTSRRLRLQPASFCYLDFEVLDAAAVRVGWSTAGCIAIVPGAIELAPRGSRRQDFTWHARTCGPEGPCVDAAPGRYSVRGLVHIFGREPLRSVGVPLQVSAW